MHDNDSTQHQAKKNITNLFNLVADNYDNRSQRYFAMTGERIISQLNPDKGSKILDIACGTGAVTVAAGQAILPDGQVQAIDMADNMLEQAARKIQRLGLCNIDLHNMDATGLDFASNYFDAAICSFGIFFMPDMLTAISEWQRVLKPAGKLLFTSFAESAFGEPIQFFKADIAEFGIELEVSQVMDVADESACTSLLNQAGYQHIKIRTEQMGFHLDSAQDWWTILISSGLRGYIEQLSTENRKTFQKTHLAHISQLADEKGIWLDVMVLFSEGRKPVKAL